MAICEGIDSNPNLGLHRNWADEHKIYNETVKSRLDDISLKSRGQKWDYRRYQKEVLDLQKELRLGTKTGIYTCSSPLNRGKKI